MKLAAVGVTSSLLFALGVNSRVEAASITHTHTHTELPPIPPEFQNFIDEYGETSLDPLDPSNNSVWVGGSSNLASFPVTGKDTDGKYTLMDYSVSPQSGAFPHIHHREDEWFYVDEGEFFFEMGDERIHATPGTLLYGPKHHLHGFVNTGTTPGRLLIEFQGAGIENWFFKASDPVTDPSTPPLQAHPGTLFELAPQYGIEHPYRPAEDIPAEFQHFLPLVENYIKPPSESVAVPEPSSSFGVSVLGAFGVILFLKRKPRISHKFRARAPRNLYLRLGFDTQGTSE